MRTPHPAFSPSRLMGLRYAPDAAHVELDVVEADLVVGAALDTLELRGDDQARELFSGLAHHERLVATMAVLGQALRAPVRLRAGACDRKGVYHPGNGLGQLMGTLASRQPYTARAAEYALDAGREANALSRAPNLVNMRWLERLSDGRTIERRRRFRRSNLYASAEQLRTFYRSPQLASLVIEVARLMPDAWRVQARAKRGPRGYWGAIRRSRWDVSKARSAAKRRAAFDVFRRQKRAFQTRKTERENSSQTTRQLTGARGSSDVGPDSWAREGRCPTPVLDSTTRPRSFVARIAEAGFALEVVDHAQPGSAIRSGLDRRPGDRGPARPATPSGTLPWTRYLARGE